MQHYVSYSHGNSVFNFQINTGTIFKLFRSCYIFIYFQMKEILVKYCNDYAIPHVSRSEFLKFKTSSIQSKVMNNTID